MLCYYVAYSIIPSLVFLNLWMAVLVVIAAGVDNTYAPPAITFLHAEQFQIPVAFRLTVSLPQKTQLYLACWVTSIFLITFLKVAPYLVPYLPQIPTFLVCFPYWFIDWRHVILVKIKSWQWQFVQVFNNWGQFKIAWRKYIGPIYWTRRGGRKTRWTEDNGIYG